MARRALRLVTAVLVLASTVGLNCANSRATNPAQLNRDNFTRLFEATVSIRVALPGGQERSGSGFIATRDGWIVTNDHVLGRRDLSPQLEYAGGHSSSMDIAYRWPRRDLAVIVPRSAPPIEPIRLGDSGRLEPGQPLFACGVPFGLGRTLTRGVVDGRSSFESPRYVVWDGILADGLSHPGNSGGPVVTQDGRLVGIHLGSVSGQSWAVIPVSLIRRTLGEARVRAELRRRRQVRESASLSPILY